MSLLCQLSLTEVPFWDQELIFLTPTVNKFSRQLNKGKWRAPMVLPHRGDEHIHQVTTTREYLLGYMRYHTQCRETDNILSLSSLPLKEQPGFRSLVLTFPSLQRRCGCDFSEAGMSRMDTRWREKEGNHQTHMRLQPYQEDLSEHGGPEGYRICQWVGVR